MQMVAEPCGKHGRVVARGTDGVSPPMFPIVANDLSPTTNRSLADANDSRRCRTRARWADWAASMMLTSSAEK